MSNQAGGCASVITHKGAIILKLKNFTAYLPRTIKTDLATTQRTENYRQRLLLDCAKRTAVHGGVGIPPAPFLNLGYSCFRLFSPPGSPKIGSLKGSISWLGVVVTLAVTFLSLYLLPLYFYLLSSSTSSFSSGERGFPKGGRID